MKIIVADCSAIYSGRGDTQLDRGVRAIMLKKDGSVSIHNDEGNKPLNYMKNAEAIESKDDDNNIVWTFDSRNESLAVTLYEVLSEMEENLIENDKGLTRDKTENHLQEWIANNPEIVGENYMTVQREFNTGAGPVDILMIDENGCPIAVEIKRVAMPPAIDQCRRYVEALLTESPRLTKDPRNSLEFLDFTKSRGVVVALDVRPNTFKYADKKEWPIVQIDSKWVAIRRDNEGFGSLNTKVGLQQLKLEFD